MAAAALAWPEDSNCVARACRAELPPAQSKSKVVRGRRSIGVRLANHWRLLTCFGQVTGITVPFIKRKLLKGTPRLHSWA